MTLTPREAWVTKWPAYCQRCKAHGTLFPSNYSPDQCPECTEKSICARCGHVGLNELGEGPCTYCYWNYDDSLPEDVELPIPEATPTALGETTAPLVVEAEVGQGEENEETLTPIQLVVVTEEGHVEETKPKKEKKA